MTRAATEFDVIYFEEAERQPIRQTTLRVRREPTGVQVATPLLTLDEERPSLAVKALVDRHIGGRRDGMIAWYYTPMALEFSAHLSPAVIVYDCMDELSAFLNPPRDLLARESQLFSRADVVFTGGRSLYEAKRGRHRQVHLFPSSIDAAHFGRARNDPPEPTDQSAIPHPRIGFFGVIDERMDLQLVTHAAQSCPEIQFVMLGPVVKVDPASLPQEPNLHWLGPKTYEQLPSYLAHWDAGWMPFALNEATRFISPTKTPEFLAAGLPLTSTAVVDVVHEYGGSGLVQILAAGDDPAPMLRASIAGRPAGWRDRVDSHLAGRSWDRTWSEMAAIIAGRRAAAPNSSQEGAPSNVPV